MLASMIVLCLGMVSSGWWLSAQIQDRVLRHTSMSSALYIESFVAPMIQNLGTRQQMAPAEIAAMDRIIHDTPLGEQIVAFIVWGSDGQVLYSSDSSQIGRKYPVTDDLNESLHGEVTWELNHTNDEPHIPPQDRAKLLLATYVPVRLRGTQQVIAVAEFYQTADRLRADILATQWQTWMVVAVVTLLMYLLLAGFVRRISDTIVWQQSELSAQVHQLTELLGQNKELHERVRRASLRSTTLNERVLRRIGADLHDGPAQQLGLSLLHLDRIAEYYEQHPATPQVGEHLDILQNALTQSLQEVRAISAGLGLPELEALTLAEVVSRVVQTHERRTRTVVRLQVDRLPEQASLPIKITLYRIIQEGLRNAFRHAGGEEQSVSVSSDGRVLQIEIADGGPGFHTPAVGEWYDHMGLSGMRERVESLGGLFTITSQPGHGTQVCASLPLNEVNERQA
jgi:signal transduction histidine kinase